MRSYHILYSLHSIPLILIKRQHFIVNAICTNCLYTFQRSNTQIGTYSLLIKNLELPVFIVQHSYNNYTTLNQFVILICCDLVVN